MSGECTIIISNEDIDFILDLLKNPPKPNQKLKDAFKFYHLKKSENMSGECDKCGEHALECRCEEFIYKYNIFREILKEIPKGKIEIIPNEPKDQKVADQLNNFLSQWWKTEEGKQQFLDILNEKFLVLPDGDLIRKDEFCINCKNELIVCVCL